MHKQLVGFLRLCSHQSITTGRTRCTLPAASRWTYGTHREPTPCGLSPGARTAYRASSSIQWRWGDYIKFQFLHKLQNRSHIGVCMQWNLQRKTEYFSLMSLQNIGLLSDKHSLDNNFSLGGDFHLNALPPMTVSESNILCMELNQSLARTGCIVVLWQSRQSEVDVVCKRITVIPSEVAKLTGPHSWHNDTCGYDFMVFQKDNRYTHIGDIYRLCTTRFSPHTLHTFMLDYTCVSKRPKGASVNRCCICRIFPFDLYYN